MQTRPPSLLLVAVPLVLGFGTAAPATDDPIRQLQIEAELSGRADWGHWGDQPGKYVSWSNHSNRLIPVYPDSSTDGVNPSHLSTDAVIYRPHLAPLYIEETPPSAYLGAHPR